MQNNIIRIILLVLTITGIVYFIKRKEKYTLLTNNIFWLCTSWLVCLLLYYFSGIQYTIELNIYSVLYIFVFLFVFVFGQFLSKKFKLFERKVNTNKDEKNINFSKKINFLPLFIIATISVIIYSIYIICINDIQFGVTRDIKTNGFSTLLQIISSSSLIIWLYELAYSILNEKRITIYGILSFIIFNIPGIIISGRDALIISFLATVIVLLYCGIFAKKVLKKDGKTFKLIIKSFGFILLIILLYLIFLTNNRYGNDENSALNMFSWSAGAQFPAYLIWIYKYMGGFGKLILNIIFYYSSQLSKFSLVFCEYDGPYMFGLYQLHYISRLLPESWNLNHKLVSEALAELTTGAGVSGLKVFWETAIGYSIYDFGRIGTIFVSFIVGILIGVIDNNLNEEESILNILVKIFICIAMFLTIEISPLFDYYYIFPLAWLVLIWIYNKKKVENNEKK